MKKAVSVILALTFALLGCGGVVCHAQQLSQYPIKRADITIRDPYVLVYDGKYYMYGTGASNRGYGCYVSEDLENWSQSVTVFEIPANFEGFDCFWAPECHYYEGSFYLFATYKSSVSDKRGVAIFRADNPLGPFEQISDGHVTPKQCDCIDGTLYVDGNGEPWMIYVREWTSSEDGIGEMAASRMSEDLSSLEGESTILFRADDPLWATGGVTDGPFMYRTKGGRLLMLWSNQSIEGYAVGIARSDDGTANGKWSHRQSALYMKGIRHKYEGGHAMLFTDLNGNLMMAIHSPNSTKNGVHETAVFIPVDDVGGTLLLNDASTRLGRAFHSVTKWLLSGYYKITLNS